MFFEWTVYMMLVGKGLLNPDICHQTTVQVNGHAAVAFYCEAPQPESEGGDAGEEEIAKHNKWLADRDARRPKWKAPMPSRSRR